MGSGPLVVMVHGFPDYWYTWRKQMAGLADKYQTVAIDQRGYNMSDKPEGVEQYDMRLLIGDLMAVIRHFGKEKAIVVGHDWGGAVAWRLASNAPQFVERLVILNVPHPRGLRRELVNNPVQAQASEYARNFQREGSEKQLTVEQLTGWVKDPEAKQNYIDALKRSDLTALMNYYRRNYPSPPYVEDTSPVVKIKMPVLMLYGLKDPRLLPPALNNTWDWMGEDFTLATFPNAGHFVQQDAADLVTRTMRAWLERSTPDTSSRVGSECAAWNSYGTAHDETTNDPVKTPDLLPLNRPRRLARHVIHHPVDALHLVDDARRGLAQKLHVELIEVRGHAVGRGHRAQAHHEVVGAAVAHHADRLHRQQHGKGLPDLVVEAVLPDLVDIDGIRVAQDVELFAA